MAEETEWLLLEDAIRVYGDPRLWTAYQDALARAKNMPPQRAWIGSAGREWPAAQIRHQRQSSSIREALTRAQRALHKDFRDRLRAGTLLAVGSREPIAPEAGPEPIPASLWDVLQLDVERNRVLTTGLAYGGVRICGAEGGRRRHTKPVNPPPVVARPPGRPSLMDAIRAELQRRADRGEMLEHWAPEAGVLALWVQGEYPEDKAPKAVSIERRLRNQYRQLKSDKKPG